MSRLGKTVNLPTPHPTLDDARRSSMMAALGLPSSAAGPSTEDEAAVRQQLGRMPQGLWVIAHRTPSGSPCVLATYPLVACPRAGWRPFPNMLWLAEVALSQAVSHLERQGQMARLQEELFQDAALARTLADDHARYAQARWRMLLPVDRQLAIERGWEQELAHRGVGGLSPQGTRIKCLHAHVAQHLVMGNVLGKRVLALL